MSPKDEPEDWERFVRARCPSYLLPSACNQKLPIEVAERLLERLTGRPGQLQVLRNASLLSARLAELRTFTGEALPDLCRVLPSTSHASRRVWEGGYAGRLDVRATLAYRVAGDRSYFVTRERRRSFDLPENVLVRRVAERLAESIELLRRKKVTADRAWGLELLEAQGQLRRALSSTALARVPSEAISGRHLHAAEHARHRCYSLAARWHRWLDRALSDDDPAQLARLVADGALLPLSADRRFELAVLLRLAEALEGHAHAKEPGRWTVEHSLLMSGRRELVALVRDDGRRVELSFDLAVLPGAEHQAMRARYLGVQGSARPDVTVRVSQPGQKAWFVVIEVKNSRSPDYLEQGFNEARIYRWEYREQLTGWPKAMLVAHPAMSGEVAVGDDVVAVGWGKWVPEVVLAAIVG